MLASLVIVSRQPDRSAPCSRLPASSPVTISPVVHPVSVQQLTKCSSRKSFVLKTIHFDGGVPPPCSRSHDHDPFVRISYLLFPFFSHICALFCAILHFLARIKYATLFFSSDSSLFGKNTRGGVRVCVATTSHGQELCEAKHLFAICCGRDPQKLSTHTDSGTPLSHRGAK